MHRKVFCVTFPIRGGKNALNQIVSEPSRRFRAGDYPKNRNNLSRSSFFRIFETDCLLVKKRLDLLQTSFLIPGNAALKKLLKYGRIEIFGLQDS